MPRLSTGGRIADCPPTCGPAPSSPTRPMEIMIMRTARHFALSAMAALLALGIAASAGAAAASSGAAEPVRSFYDVLLSTMKQGERLGPDGRYAALEPIVRRSFDIPYMTRIAVGPSWSSLPDAKRQQLTEAFGRHITATWADRLAS